MAAPTQPPDPARPPDLSAIARSRPAQVSDTPTPEEFDLADELQLLGPLLERHRARLLAGMPYDWLMIADALSESTQAARTLGLLRLEQQIGDIGADGAR
ncbi:hypothetical protein [Actinophytocola sediminis]